jgi:Domain of unknown function (DUF4258)
VPFDSTMTSPVLALVRRYLAAGSWRLSAHAIDRMEVRGLTSPEIEQALFAGSHEIDRDKTSAIGTAHAIRGCTVDGKDLRVVVSFRAGMLIVTVIDLDASPDWT